MVGASGGAAPRPLVEPWGVCQRDGKEVQLVTLVSESGAQLKVCTFGATIVSLHVPDAQGCMDDVLLGFDNLQAYEDHTTYMGCAVGRTCSRIAGARFTLDGQVCNLPANNGHACHHGGPVGFNAYTWDIVEKTPTSVKLRHVSPHMDMGYPGRLTVLAEYGLLPTDDGGDALLISFNAHSDRKTVCNLTNHVYFNLAGNSGDMQTSMYDHVVTINADHFLPVDEGNIPLGELRDVSDTPFDFRRPCRIGKRIEVEDEQLRIAAGYDHNYALRETFGGSRGGRGGTRQLGLELAPDGRSWTRKREADAIAVDVATGRCFELFTEEPAVHFYSGNYLGHDPMGKGGLPIARRAGFCLETQHFTNSPNEPRFPSVVLQPGERWETRTVFWFPRPSTNKGMLSACCCR